MKGKNGKPYVSNHMRTYVHTYNNSTYKIGFDYNSTIKLNEAAKKDTYTKKTSFLDSSCSYKRKFKKACNIPKAY